MNRPRSAAGVLHVRCAPTLTPECYREVLDLLREFSPVVQALPPRAALVQVRGAQRYFGADPARIAEVVRLRAVARLGTDVRIGVAGTWAVAAMASARIPGPGGTLTVPDDPAAVAGFLAPLPVDALHGLGSRQAEALRGYGLHTVGALTRVPPGVLERILGKRSGRLVADRARGIDPRPVTPATCPPRPPSAPASPARNWTARTPAPPSSPSSSASAPPCADAARPPAPCP